MMTHQELKEIAWNEIDRKSDYLIDIAKRILKIPETGFMEFKTSEYVSNKLSELKIQHRQGIALTGIKGYLEGMSPGPTIAVMGELDSVRVKGHEYADPSTSAAHACGHHCQIGMMIGVAVGLKASGILENLSGRIAFMALPAEEFIDVEYRYELHKNNQIEFMSGKQEFLRLGEFADIDMAMMTHTSHVGNTKFLLGGTTNGHFVKYIRFLGKAAHAGGAPHNGVNALQAAIVALNALNTQRETFQNEETVRLHGIMTSGGVSVSSIPSEVKYEGRVRGGSMEAIEDANEKMDRCLRAGALAIGAKVEIITIPGYLPLINNQELSDMFSSNAGTIVGTDAVRISADNVNRGGSTDLGDLSHIMPVIHPYTGCATGSGHGIDYLVQDYVQGVINPAKAMAATVIDLLSDHSQGAFGILDKFVPRLSTDDYIASQRARFHEELYEGI